MKTSYDIRIKGITLPYEEVMDMAEDIAFSHGLEVQVISSDGQVLDEISP